jgi:hypothetical protein
MGTASQSQLRFYLLQADHTTLLPNARVIRHVDTRRDVASWRRRMGRSVSWPLIPKLPIARQPDLRLSTPAVAYCSAIGWRGTLGECGVDDMHQVRYVAQGMLLAIRPLSVSAGANHRSRLALSTILDLAGLHGHRFACCYSAY